MKHPSITAMAFSIAFACQGALATNTSILSPAPAPVGSKAASELSTEPATRSMQWVEPDAELLRSEAKSLWLKLPDGRDLRIDVDVRNISKLGSTLLEGTVTEILPIATAGEIGSQALFAINGDSVSGSISLPQVRLDIRPEANDRHAFLELDQSLLRSEDHVVAHSTSQKSTIKPQPPITTCNLPTVATSSVDLMVAVDNQLGLSASGRTALAEQSVMETNVAMQRSEIPVSLVLADVIELAGVPTVDVISNYYDILDTSTSFAQQFRNEWNARGTDLAVLISKAPTNSANCGVAASLTPSADEAFAVVAGNLACEFTFAHEIGHLFSAGHNVEQGSAPDQKPYAHGFFRSFGGGEPGYRSLMSYQTGLCPGCRRELFFSTPRVLDDIGRPLGDCHTRDNSRAMTEEGARVAALRTYAPVTVSPDSYESDNSMGQAVPLYAGSQQTHNLHTASDVDWQMFYVPPGYNVNLQMTGPATIQASMELRIQPHPWTILSSYVVATAGPSSNGVMSVTHTAPIENHGTIYFVRVAHSGGGSFSPTLNSYVIGVDGLLPPSTPDSYEADNTHLTAVPLNAIDPPQHKTYHVSGDEDWSIFYVPNGVAFQVVFSGFVTDFSEATLFHENYYQDGNLIIDHQVTGTPLSGNGIRLQGVGGMHPSGTVFYVRMRAPSSFWQGLGTAYQVSVQAQ